MNPINDVNERKHPYILRANYMYANRDGHATNDGGAPRFHLEQRKQAHAKKVVNQLRLRPSFEGEWLVQYKPKLYAPGVKPPRIKCVVNIGTESHPCMSTKVYGYQPARRVGTRVGTRARRELKRRLAMRPHVKA